MACYLGNILSSFPHLKLPVSRAGQVTEGGNAYLIHSIIQTKPGLSKKFHRLVLTIVSGESWQHVWAADPVKPGIEPRHSWKHIQILLRYGITPNTAWAHIQWLCVLIRKHNVLVYRRRCWNTAMLLGSSRSDGSQAPPAPSPYLWIKLERQWLFPHPLHTVYNDSCWRWEIVITHLQRRAWVYWRNTPVSPCAWSILSQSNV